MDRPMRRKDRQISREEAVELLRQGEYGVLSTVGEEGAPYGIPLSYVLLDEAIYFHCAKIGRKIDNMAHESRVSFCVVGPTKPVYDGGFSTYYECAVVQGTAALVEDKQEWLNALNALCEKYLPDHMEKAHGDIEHSGKMTAVYKITADSITGKAKRPKE